MTSDQPPPGVIGHSPFSEEGRMNERYPPERGPLYGPQVQRYRDYQRMRQMSTDDLLMENRIIFLGSSRETGGLPEINDYLANLTIQKLLFLQYENRTQEIHMYINCPGGSVGYGQISDLEIEAKEMLRDRQRLDEIMAKHTGQTVETINKETERDRYFHPQEAKDYGIVDEVLTRQ